MNENSKKQAGSERQSDGSGNSKVKGVFDKRQNHFSNSKLDVHLILSVPSVQLYFHDFYTFVFIANRSLENEIFLGLLSDCSVLLCLWLALFICPA